MLRNIFRLTSFIVIGIILNFVGCKANTENTPAFPGKINIILIVVDDLGYGDLGSYGSELHRTPNIDKLANGGMLFTDFHTNGPVCSPTRAALMTGQYQQRSGIESAIGFVKDEGVPLSKVTIAEVLSENGYTCGLVGKWHLGHVNHFGPNYQGFDLSYCSNNSPDYHSLVSRAGELDWFKNHELYEESGYLTRLVTDHSIEFIEVNKEQPFFLFVSHPAVHFPFQGPNDPPFRTTGKEWHGNERIPGKVQADSKYGPLPSEEYKRAYRDMLEAVDLSVGEVVGALEKFNLRQRTLIVITSDNGAYSWVGSNGKYRGQKGDLFEGGHRVPCIFNWPGKVPTGTLSSETTITMDLAPMFMSIAGVKESANVSFDGIDISSVLFEQGSLPSRTLFWRFNNAYTNSHARAVRKGDWKYVLEEDRTYLFNLIDDPGEQNNLALAKPDLVRKMNQEYTSWEQDVTGGVPAR